MVWQELNFKNVPQILKIGIGITLVEKYEKNVNFKITQKLFQICNY